MFLDQLPARLLSLTSVRQRQGSSADRGKMLRFPAVHGEPMSFLRRVAPGIVTGAADVDPALVLTATVVGAVFGYRLLWVVALCVPFLLTVFAVSARIGHQTRRGLVDLLLHHYGRTVAVACAAVIVVINMAMLVADLMAVSEALSIVLDQRRVFFVAAAAFTVWYILIFRDYHKITHALAFLSLPLFIYVAAAVASNPPVAEVVRSTFIPSLSGNFAYGSAVLALFGSLLTPYVLVWQTSSRREHAETGQAIHSSEHFMGALVSSVLCFSIIVAAATVLRSAISADSPLTVRMAANALSPAVGEAGPVLFALGIIGSGLVALPILVASLCYSVSEAMGWESGLSANPWEAKRFYVLISASLFIAAALNFFHFDPVTALYGSQILAGILTVPILVFILLLSNDRRVMRTVNSRLQNFWIGAAAGGLGAAGLLVLAWKLRGY